MSIRDEWTASQIHRCDAKIPIVYLARHQDRRKGASDTLRRKPATVHPTKASLLRPDATILGVAVGFAHEGPAHDGSARAIMP